MTQPPTRGFFIALVAVTTLGPLSMQILAPALPIIQRDFGVAGGTAQLALSVSMWAIALSTLAYGPLSDSFGRRPVMIVGLAVFLVGSLLCALAPNIWILIVGRAVQAAGGTAGMVIARAIVRDVYAEEKVAGVIAYLTMAMVVAPMLAPAIGGVLTEAMGWPAIFGFAGLVGIPVMLLVVSRLAETHGVPAGHRGVGGMLGAFAMLLRSPAYRSYAFHGAFALASFFALVAGAPHIMVNVLDRPVSEYGYYFIVISLSFMAGNYVSARIHRRVGIDRMILIGSLIALGGVAVAAVLAMTGVWHPLAIFAPSTVIVFGNGLTMANAQAGALSVHLRSAGTASGLSGFLQMAIAGVFAQAVGTLQGDTPSVTVGFMFAGLLLSLGAFLLGQYRHRRDARIR